MKEYIERAAAMESIIGLTIVDPAVAQYANAVYYNLQNLHAADVVEVVRCKDCIHLGFCGEATNLEVMGFYGFCSRGQRKEADHE